MRPFLIGVALLGVFFLYQGIHANLSQDSGVAFVAHTISFSEPPPITTTPVSSSEWANDLGSFLKATQSPMPDRGENKSLQGDLEKYQKANDKLLKAHKEQSEYIKQLEERLNSANGQINYLNILVKNWSKTYSELSTQYSTLVTRWNELVGKWNKFVATSSNAISSPSLTLSTTPLPTPDKSQAILQLTESNWENGVFRKNDSGCVNLFENRFADPDFAFSKLVQNCGTGGTSTSSSSTYCNVVGYTEGSNGTLAPKTIECY